MFVSAGIEEQMGQSQRKFDNTVKGNSHVQNVSNLLLFFSYIYVYNNDLNGPL